MKSTEIRSRFLDYFKRNGHTVVPSSSLVPGNDPTLLFVNAGMVQFKDVFLGTDKRAYVRAASSQRCVRAGGKHNDLENVGYTARHHTFFEMLGNFSFGDYFKREAIQFGWEFLTKDMKLPPEKLWVTVYKDDNEAADIWIKEIGIDPARLSRLGESSNFWQMGDTGPCGPCSEIFYDHGANIAGGPPGSPDEDGDRYVEIWNLVFMQFNRDASGKLTPLPKPSVDTGMGLERIAAVQQGVHSNYDIDLFRNLIKAAARETHVKDLSNNSLKVIADHIRACSFLIVDGVIPGNEGRGYVLRRIIRRAIRHGYKLGQKAPFFHGLVKDLVAEMGDAYPELATAATRVTEVLRQEEERFYETIANGMEMLESALAGLKSGAILDGETAFKLHDTYGFPLDLTADIGRERNVTVDEKAFNTAMERQREQARAAGKFKVAAGLEYHGDKSTFHGYEKLVVDNARVIALYVDGVSAPSVRAGQDAIVVLDHTPFYAESGGQVGDAGVLEGGGTEFSVSDTQKIQADVFGHHGRLQSGELKVGSTLVAKVDAARRAQTMRNHSATHLMHKALRQVLGEHVQQKGSLVDAEKTRFDFSHNTPMTGDEIRRVEQLVNAEVLKNEETKSQVMSFDEAVKGGAMALFGEKYGDAVRVLDIGFSRELCGGTHVRRTGDIGLFKIVSEGGVAAGVRRVEAVAGEGVLAYLRDTESKLKAVADILRANPDEAPRKVEQLQTRIKVLEKDVEQLRGKLARGESVDLASQAREVNGVKVLAARLDGVDAKGLREAIDQLRDKLAPAAVVLASVIDNKVTLIAGVTKELAGRVHAGELVNQVAIKVGGKGGGRPDMAQAGGTDPSGLETALSDVHQWVAERLG